MPDRMMTPRMGWRKMVAWIKVGGNEKSDLEKDSGKGGNDTGGNDKGGNDEAYRKTQAEKEGHGQLEEAKDPRGGPAPTPPPTQPKRKPSPRPAGHAQRGHEAQGRNQTQRTQPDRQDPDQATKPTTRQTSTPGWPGTSEAHYPIALRIISAFPDCNTELYCCQAKRMSLDRSALSSSVAHERTKATVSSARRPLASKTRGTNSPPEGAGGDRLRFTRAPSAAATPSLPARAC